MVRFVLETRRTQVQTPINLRKQLTWPVLEECCRWVNSPPRNVCSPIEERFCQEFLSRCFARHEPEYRILLRSAWSRSSRCSFVKVCQSIMEQIEPICGCRWRSGSFGLKEKWRLEWCATSTERGHFIFYHFVKDVCSTILDGYQRDSPSLRPNFPDDFLRTQWSSLTFESAQDTALTTSWQSTSQDGFFMPIQ